MSTALVIGEALIDIVHRPGAPSAEHPGGSPMNVAIGLARQGIPTTLLTAIGTDPHGQLITEHLSASAVHLHPDSKTSKPTSIAAATIGADGAATYQFDIHWQVPAATPAPDTKLIHTGSIASVLRPGRDNVAALFTDLTVDAVRSFDPNIRAGLIGNRQDALDAIDYLARNSHIVKLSDEDAAWLLPGASPEAVLDHFTVLGATLTAITLGSAGALLRVGTSVEQLPAPPVDVADTIGAGDAFMAGLLAAAVRTHALEELRTGPLDTRQAKALANGALEAARITVSRAGANPPWEHELDAAKGWARSSD